MYFYFFSPIIKKSTGVIFSFGSLELDLMEKILELKIEAFLQTQKS